METLREYYEYELEGKCSKDSVFLRNFRLDNLKDEQLIYARLYLRNKEHFKVRVNGRDITNAIVKNNECDKDIAGYLLDGLNQIELLTNCTDEIDVEINIVILREVEK